MVCPIPYGDHKKDILQVIEGWYSATAYTTPKKIIITRMWANAHRDGRPAEYRWRPLFNAAKFG